MCEKQNKNVYFLKNGCNDFDQILWVNSTLEAQQYDTITFPGKFPETRKIVFIFLSVA